MTQQPIQLNITDNGIATLTINRPAARNALNDAAMHGFASAIQSLSQRDDVRVLILRGAGDRAFCSGGDLYELSQRPTEQDARDFITLMGDALYQMEQLPYPVIAAINGYALGGGCEIALACDLRFADESVQMGMVQIRLKLTPGWGAGQRLARLVGVSKAMQILLSAKIYSADDLQQIGLINELVPAGQAYDHALQFAQRIATEPPQVVQSIKRLLQASYTQPYETALQTERDLFPSLWAAQPHHDAVDAFLQRQASKAKSSTESDK